MTFDQFITLQKDVYRPGEAWLKLIHLYNKHNNTQLPHYLKSTYITILIAIAKKNGWDFKPIDLQKYLPRVENGKLVQG